LKKQLLYTQCCGSALKPDPDPTKRCGSRSTTLISYVF
jgi:hypothetical protein